MIWWKDLTRLKVWWKEEAKIPPRKVVKVIKKIIAGLVTYQIHKITLFLAIFKLEIYFFMLISSYCIKDPYCAWFHMRLPYIHYLKIAVFALMLELTSIGGSREAPPPPPPLFLDQTDAWRAQKAFWQTLFVTPFTHNISWYIFFFYCSYLLLVVRI